MSDVARRDLTRRGRLVMRRTAAAPVAAAVGLVVLPVVHVLLRTGVVRHRTLVGKLPVGKLPVGKLPVELATQQPDRAESTARSIAEGIGLGASVWRLRRTSCLARATLTWWLCRRRGIGAELRFGLSTDGSRTGHAWVEYDGEVLDDAPDVASRFVVFSGDDPEAAQ